MENGETWSISKGIDELSIAHTPPPPDLQRQFPNLYGVLLTAHTRIDEATGYGWLGGMLCLAIAISWLVHLFVPALDHKGTHGTVWVVCAVVWSTVDDRFERIQYEAMRDDVHDKIRDAGLDQATLVALLAKDERVERALEFLKRDTKPR
ncbi:MAG: hypothetical protein OER88_13060 [Planctomycetota bacterium]|nr:hypothetical protein [Planctomycetota bacterium]